MSIFKKVWINWKLDKWYLLLLQVLILAAIGTLSIFLYVTYWPNAKENRPGFETEVVVGVPQEDYDDLKKKLKIAEDTALNNAANPTVSVEDAIGNFKPTKDLIQALMDGNLVAAQAAINDEQKRLGKVLTQAEKQERSRLEGEVDKAKGDLAAINTKVSNLKFELKKLQDVASKYKANEAKKGKKAALHLAEHAGAMREAEVRIPALENRNQNKTNEVNGVITVVVVDGEIGKAEKQVPKFENIHKEKIAALNTFDKQMKEEWRKAEDYSVFDLWKGKVADTAAEKEGLETDRATLGQLHAKLEKEDMIAQVTKYTTARLKTQSMEAEQKVLESKPLIKGAQEKIKESRTLAAQLKGQLEEDWGEPLSGELLDQFNEALKDEEPEIEPEEIQDGDASISKPTVFFVADPKGGLKPTPRRNKGAGKDLEIPAPPPGILPNGKPDPDFNPNPNLPALPGANQPGIQLPEPGNGSYGLSGDKWKERYIGKLQAQLREHLKTIDEQKKLKKKLLTDKENAGKDSKRYKDRAGAFKNLLAERDNKKQQDQAKINRLEKVEDDFQGYKDRATGGNVLLAIKAHHQEVLETERDELLDEQKKRNVVKTEASRQIERLKGNKEADLLPDQKVFTKQVEAYAADPDMELLLNAAKKNLEDVERKIDDLDAQISDWEDKQTNAVVKLATLKTSIASAEQELKTFNTDFDSNSTARTTLLADLKEALNRKEELAGVYQGLSDPNYWGKNAIKYYETYQSSLTTAAINKETTSKNAAEKANELLEGLEDQNGTLHAALRYQEKERKEARLGSKKEERAEKEIKEIKAKIKKNDTDLKNAKTDAEENVEEHAMAKTEMEKREKEDRKVIEEIARRNDALDGPETLHAEVEKLKFFALFDEGNELNEQWRDLRDREVVQLLTSATGKKEKAQGKAKNARGKITSYEDELKKATDELDAAEAALKKKRGDFDKISTEDNNDKVTDQKVVVAKIREAIQTFEADLMAQKLVLKKAEAEAKYWDALPARVAGARGGSDKPEEPEKLETYHVVISPLVRGIRGEDEAPDKVRFNIVKLETLEGKKQKDRDQALQKELADHEKITMSPLKDRLKEYDSTRDEIDKADDPKTARKKIDPILLSKWKKMVEDDGKKMPWGKELEDGVILFASKKPGTYIFYGISVNKDNRPHFFSQKFEVGPNLDPTGKGTIKQRIMFQPVNSQ